MERCGIELYVMGLFCFVFIFLLLSTESGVPNSGWLETFNAFVSLLRIEKALKVSSQPLLGTPDSVLKSKKIKTKHLKIRASQFDATTFHLGNCSARDYVMGLFCFVFICATRHGVTAPYRKSIKGL
jgi:hypothetical protein